MSANPTDTAARLTCRWCGAKGDQPHDGATHDAYAASDPPGVGYNTARKGLIFGECGTPGCTNKARWIPTSDIPIAPQPFIYRCPPCCDRIDAERRAP